MHYEPFMCVSAGLHLFEQGCSVQYLTISEPLYTDPMATVLA